MICLGCNKKEARENRKTCSPRCSKIYNRKAEQDYRKRFRKTEYYKDYCRKYYRKVKKKKEIKLLKEGRCKRCGVKNKNKKYLNCEDCLNKMVEYRRQYLLRKKAMEQR